MKHDWKAAPRPDRHPMGLPCRKCAACGFFQTMSETYSWGRMVSRAWWPKVGRVCPGAILTMPQLSALIQVDAGKVKRVYKRNGNVLIGPKGVSSTVLWKLHTLQLICDLPSITDTHLLQVTAKGRAALEQNQGAK